MYLVIDTYFLVRINSFIYNASQLLILVIVSYYWVVIANIRNQNIILVSSQLAINIMR